jgi:endonuclease YncB( thermonuclease family)
MKRLFKGLLLIGTSCLLMACGEDKSLIHKTLYSSGINPIDVRVSYVIDGDTFVYEVDNHPSETVNLGCAIMAYEMNTPYGAEAKKKLEELLPRGSKVTIFPTSINSKDEINALVLNQEGAYVNKEVAIAGTAFVNPDFDTEPICFKEPPNVDYSPSQGIGDGLARGYTIRDQKNRPFPWQMNK